jgi:hypothetical protein
MGDSGERRVRRGDRGTSSARPAGEATRAAGARSWATGRSRRETTTWAVSVKTRDERAERSGVAARRSRRPALRDRAMKCAPWGGARSRCRAGARARRSRCRAGARARRSRCRAVEGEPALRASPRSGAESWCDGGRAGWAALARPHPEGPHRPGTSAGASPRRAEAAGWRPGPRRAAAALGRRA